MHTAAVVMEEPGAVGLRQVDLAALGPSDILVDVAFTGISTGTERLLWAGEMPTFPGMGYPLVPGYETVGRVIDAGTEARERVGEWVFVPGSRGFVGVHSLFGGAARRVIADARRVSGIDADLGEAGILLALAATAHHAIAAGEAPDLVVGHGVMGRLTARLVPVLFGTRPVVWEINERRRAGAAGYEVVDPRDVCAGQYRSIVDVSGDTDIIDKLLPVLARGGEIVLAGFYKGRPSFNFPKAFLKEARLRVAAEWAPEDLVAVAGFVRDGRLDLDGLITHRAPADSAEAAYPRAFTDPDCLKMVLDWRSIA